LAWGHGYAAGGCAPGCVQVSVLDRIPKDSGEHGQQLLQRSRSQRHHSAVSHIPKVRTGLQRLTQVLRLTQLVCLELQAQVTVDFIETVATEEPLEMPCPPAVVAASVRTERLFPENAVEPGCQSVLDVVIEERDLSWSDDPRNLTACGLLPHASFHARDDLV
jgi:hypothetical protein